MSRNFGLPHREGPWRSFWREPEGEREPIWPLVVIGVTVAVIAALGIFVA